MLASIEARLARLERQVSNQNRLLLIGIIALVGELAKQSSLQTMTRLPLAHPASHTRGHILPSSKKWLADISLFSRLVTRRPLRRYQLEIAGAIVDSILHQRGLTFAVMLPRQAGKNETQAQVEAYLLNLFQRVPGAQIVKASPTFKPQTINSLMRLETMLANAWNAGQWSREQGYIIRLGHARVLFFSAEPTANVVGATASILLECDEAQDVDPAKWQKDFMPMVASTNATRVLWGTAWTSQTLLATTIGELRELEAAGRS